MRGSGANCGSGKGGSLNNPCFWSSITITAGAVIVFFIALGSVTRSAYLAGFAEGFTQARARFERIIKAAKAEKLFRGLLDDIDKGEE